MKKFIKLAVLLVLPSISYADVDWTIVLNSIKNSCDFSSLKKYGFAPTEHRHYFSGDFLPKHLQNSIKSNIYVNEGFNLELNNATAFGSKLYQIHGDVTDWGDGVVTLHFADDNFMKVLPDFYYYSVWNNGSMSHEKIRATPYMVVKENIDDLGSNYRTSPTGYYVYDAAIERAVEFNRENRTIKCTSFFHRE